VPNGKLSAPCPNRFVIGIDLAAKFTAKQRDQKRGFFMSKGFDVESIPKYL
jgi:hypothetical protein